MAYEPTAEELAAAPKITAGGKAFPIIRQAPRQTRIIIPLAFKVQGLLGTPEQFTPENLDDLGTVIWTALHRGNPAVTREEFDDLSMGLDEMMTALAIVLQQCGMGVEVPGVTGQPPLAAALESPPAPKAT